MTFDLFIPLAVALAISAATVPVIGRIATDLGIIAEINDRTVHNGIIPRAGGYAIYFSFIICAALFLKTDNQINSILMGGFIIFMTGFIDDIKNLKPKQKLFGQILGTLVVIFYGGISLNNLPLSFLPPLVVQFICLLISIGWIVGITNAINLIDGLDGLCAGISIIVLLTIASTAYYYNRTDITALSLILSGAIGGFLVFNFHPAKIFMGDCGALFIGFMIAVISLLGFGFKSTAFFTLGAPIVVLAVPIMDTTIAIIRRKLAHKRFDEADRGHVHHQLMFTLKLGHVRSVLVLYAATILFSICSYLYIDHRKMAIILFIILLISLEIFVEVTEMVTQFYKPILTIANIFIKSDKLPKIKDTYPYRMLAERALRYWKRVVIACLVVLIGIFGYKAYQKEQNKETINYSDVYKQSKNETELMTSIYKHLEETVPANRTNLCRYVSAYFASDYFSISNKKKDQIGGISYLYKASKADFKAYSKESYYKNVNQMIEDNCQDEITKYKVKSIEPSNITLNGLEDYDYYDVTLTLTFNDISQILNVKKFDVVVTLIEKDNRLRVVALDYFIGE